MISYVMLVCTIWYTIQGIYIYTQVNIKKGWYTECSGFISNFQYHCNQLALYNGAVKHAHRSFFTSKVGPGLPLPR